MAKDQIDDWPALEITIFAIILNVFIASCDVSLCLTFLRLIECSIFVGLFLLPLLLLLLRSAHSLSLHSFRFSFYLDLVHITIKRCVMRIGICIVKRAAIFLAYFPFHKHTNMYVYLCVYHFALHSQLHFFLHFLQAIVDELNIHARALTHTIFFLRYVSLNEKKTWTDRLSFAESESVRMNKMAHLNHNNIAHTLI